MYKTSTLLLLMLIANAVTSQPLSKKVIVKGKITIQPIYKGGAKPTAEVLEQCCKPRPFVNSKVFLKTDYYSKPLYTIKTDGQGNFTKRLKPGNYNVFLVNVCKKENRKANRKPDATVINPDAILNVGAEKNTSLELIIRERMAEIPKP